jgi:hypothetical protein
MKRFLAGFAVGVLLAAAPAQAELRGKVYVAVNPDAPRTEWRRVPLPGAFVIVDWTVTIAAPAHAVTSCRYSEIARTDTQGDYVMDGPNFVTASLARTGFSVYATGLEPVNFPGGGSPATPQDITMTWSKVPASQRLSRLSAGVDPGCGSLERKVSDPRGVLGAYLQALLDEAKMLPADSQLAREHLRSIEAAVRRNAGLDKPGPLRAVIVPAPGAVQSQKLPAGAPETAGPLR